MTSRIALGAEAEVVAQDFLGRAAVAKIRAPKRYRHPELDRRLRRERTRAEALLLAEARRAGVPVPAVLDADVEAGTLRMTRIEGPSLRMALEDGAGDPARLSRDFGALLARFHQAGLIHGDPTTSNVHVDPRGLHLLDLGLSFRSVDVEDRGVDLHLVERTFEASHPGKRDLFDAFVQGYASVAPDAKQVVARMNEIKARARYV